MISFFRSPTVFEVLRVILICLYWVSAPRETTLTVKELKDLEGRGTEMSKKGSNLIDFFEHIGQVRVDLNIPTEKLIRSSLRREKKEREERKESYYREGSDRGRKGKEMKRGDWK
jgi:hypothetical protein